MAHMTLEAPPGGLGALGCPSGPSAALPPVARGHRHTKRTQEAPTRAGLGFRIIKGLSVVGVLEGSGFRALGSAFWGA